MNKNPGTVLSHSLINIMMWHSIHTRGIQYDNRYRQIITDLLRSYTMCSILVFFCQLAHKTDGEEIASIEQQVWCINILIDFEGYPKRTKGQLHRINLNLSYTNFLNAILEKTGTSRKHKLHNTIMFKKNDSSSMKNEPITLKKCLRFGTTTFCVHVKCFPTFN